MLSSEEAPDGMGMGLQAAGASTCTHVAITCSCTHVTKHLHSRDKTAVTRFGAFTYLCALNCLRVLTYLCALIC